MGPVFNMFLISVCTKFLKGIRGQGCFFSDCFENGSCLTEPCFSFHKCFVRGPGPIGSGSLVFFLLGIMG